MPVDPSSLSKALTAIKKTYGEDSVVKGTDKPKLRRIPTGSLGLDYATGGGVPLGRWCHFYGGRSSGKTLAAYNIIANAQKMGLSCAYYNIEKQYDAEWCAKHGIDVGALELVQGAQIEEVGAKLETLLGSIHIHVIDSLAAAVSMDELATKAEEWRPGIGARAWGKVIRRVNDRFDDTENLIIMINQTRKTFGYGGGEEPPGGVAIDYISRLSLLFRRSSWLYHNASGVLDTEGTGDESMTGDKEPDGIEFQVRVAKTAGFGRPDRTARLRLDYSTGQYDETFTLVSAALFHKIIERDGPKSSWYRYGDKKVQGKNGVRELIEGNKKLQETIRNKMLENA